MISKIFCWFGFHDPKEVRWYVGDGLSYTVSTCRHCGNEDFDGPNNKDVIIGIDLAHECDRGIVVTSDIEAGETIVTDISYQN